MSKIKKGTERVGHDVKKGTEDAGHDVKKGTEYAGHEIKEGAEYAGHDVKKGAEYAGHDVKKGTEYAGQINFCRSKKASLVISPFASRIFSICFGSFSFGVPFILDLVNPGSKSRYK